LHFYDSRGLYLPRLLAATPRRKTLFSRAFLSLSPATEPAQAAALSGVFEMIGRQGKASAARRGDWPSALARMLCPCLPVY